MKINGIDVVFHMSGQRVDGDTTVQPTELVVSIDGEMAEGSQLAALCGKLNDAPGLLLGGAAAITTINADGDCEVDADSECGRAVAQIFADTPNGILD